MKNDFTKVGTKGYLTIHKLWEGQFSIRSDRIKGLDELRVRIEETDKKYRILGTDFESKRFRKEYGKKSLFGESQNYDLWYYRVSELESLNKALPKESYAESRWEKGREVIKEAKQLYFKGMK